MLDTSTLSPEDKKRLAEIAGMFTDGGPALIEHLFQLEKQVQAKTTETPIDVQAEKVAMKLAAKLATLEKGDDGTDGVDGTPGPKGDRGEPGKSIQGPQGKPGKDSKVPGPKGDRGEQGPPGAPGKDGKDGVDASPDTPEEIRTKLEQSLAEDPLDAAKYVKNLPKGGRDLVVGANRALYQLLDVEVSGITAGQSIQWDGRRWIPYTPAGGVGSTPVYSEVPSGSGTTFTVAHTPIAGSLRLYRGGSRQKLGTSSADGDYSIAGATITFFTAVSAGEVLEADYNY